jgi:hypothetical protein
MVALLQLYDAAHRGAATTLVARSYQAKAGEWARASRPDPAHLRLRQHLSDLSREARLARLHRTWHAELIPFG